MTITYDDIDSTKRGQVTDLLSKRESIEGALADIQNERASMQAGWNVKEQELHAEVNRLTETIRKIRKATLV